MTAQHTPPAETIRRPKLLTEKEAAEYLGVSPATLTVWRCTRRYPLAFLKIGRCIRYRPEALEEFMESRTFGR